MSRPHYLGMRSTLSSCLKMEYWVPTTCDPQATGQLSNYHAVKCCAKIDAARFKLSVCTPDQVSYCIRNICVVASVINPACCVLEVKSSCAKLGTLSALPDECKLDGTFLCYNGSSNGVRAYLTLDSRLAGGEAALFLSPRCATNKFASWNDHRHDYWTADRESAGVGHTCGTFIRI